MLIISIVATLLVIEYFIDVPLLTGFRSQVTLWGVIIYNSAAIIGAAFLWLTHGKTLVAPGGISFNKLRSAIALVSFISVCLIALVYGPRSGAYTKMYNNTLLPILITTFGIIYIYSFEAVYRSFRIRNIEALALFLSGVTYLFKEIPIVVSIVPSVVPMAEWVLNYPSKAALAVGVLSTALGALMVGIRTILGRERVALE